MIGQAAFRSSRRAICAPRKPVAPVSRTQRCGVLPFMLPPDGGLSRWVQAPSLCLDEILEQRAVALGVTQVFLITTPQGVSHAGRVLQQPLNSRLQAFVQVVGVRLDEEILEQAQLPVDGLQPQVMADSDLRDLGSQGEHAGVIAGGQQQFKAAQDRDHLRSVVLAGAEDPRPFGVDHVAVHLTEQDFVQLLPSRSERPICRGG